MFNDTLEPRWQDRPHRRTCLRHASMFPARSRASASGWMSRASARRCDNRQPGDARLQRSADVATAITASVPPLKTKSVVADRSHNERAAARSINAKTGRPGRSNNACSS